MTSPGPSTSVLSPMTGTSRSSRPSSSGSPPSASSSGQPHSRYDLSKLLGTGSFGEIYLATDKKTGQDVAIKAEPKKAKNPQLRHEFNLYSNHLSGVEGFPKVFDLLRSSSHTYFTMSLLGPSLDTLINDRYDNHFSEKTVLMLAIQMLQRLEAFHDKTQHVHR